MNPFEWPFFGQKTFNKFCATKKDRKIKGHSKGSFIETSTFCCVLQKHALVSLNATENVCIHLIVKKQKNVIFAKSRF